MVASRLNGLCARCGLDAPKAETVYFRVLTGKVQSWRPANTARTASRSACRKPVYCSVGQGEAKELLLKLNLPKGKSEWGIRYELLR